MFVGYEVDLRVGSVKSTRKGTYCLKSAFHSVLISVLQARGVPEWNTRHCVMQNNVVYHSPLVVIDRAGKRYLSCCSVFETLGRLPKPHFRVSCAPF